MLYAESMNFIRQAGAGAILVALTICLQSVGMAAFIDWVRTGFAHRIGRFGAVRSTRLIIRFTTVLFTLHLLQILLWAGFYRWFCFTSWEESLYFSITSFSTVGYGETSFFREYGGSWAQWRVLPAC